MNSRRETLKIIGAIGTTCAFPFASDELYGQHAHVPAVNAEFGPPQFFGAKDFQTISRMTDLIIPRTDTPGAVDAQVPNYIDLVVNRNPEHQPIYRDGLLWLDRQSMQLHSKPFSELTEEQQIAILTPVAEKADRGELSGIGEKFFRSIKNMTADGYYTSRDGLTKELGYKGGAVLSRFPTCEVPEH